MPQHLHDIILHKSKRQIWWGKNACGDKKNACGDNASAPLNLLVIAEANRSSSTKLTKKKPCLGGTRDFFDIVEAGLGVIILKFVSNRN
jgi:hypothetical protein